MVKFPLGSATVVAGWSSLVARRAHNPKVGGSNPSPATKQIQGSAEMQIPFLLPQRPVLSFLRNLLDMKKRRAVLTSPKERENPFPPNIILLMEKCVYLSAGPTQKNFPNIQEG